MFKFERWPPRPFLEKCVRCSLPSLLALLLALGTAITVVAQPRAVRSDADQGAALVDGVVVAPSHGLAFVMRPGSRLEAVDLASGAVRWRSDAGAKPLAVVEGRLVAQAESRTAGALALVVFDAGSGAVRESARLPLPEGVQATLVDTPAGSFRARAERTDSQLRLRWQAAATSAEGVAQGYLPASSEGLTPAVEGGEAVVDFSQSQLRVTTAPSSSGASGASPMRPLLEELRAPAVAGGGRQWLSADGRHVLVSEPAPVNGFTLDRHRWTVYERASGERLGSVAAPVAAMPFLVVGGTLYHATPAHAALREGRMVEQSTTLKAVDLASGTERWTMAVAETSFRGPFPP
jgi:hypothetical protein